MLKENKLLIDILVLKKIKSQKDHNKITLQSKTLLLLIIKDK